MAALDFGAYVLLGIAAVLFLLLQSWLAATVVRRVVGVPTGWPRTIGVGLVMSAVMALTVQYLYRAGTDRTPAASRWHPVSHSCSCCWRQGGSSLWVSAHSS